jgi:hypothetical protein
MGAGFSYLDAAQVEQIYALNTQQIGYLRKIRLAAEGGGPESDALRQALAEARGWNSGPFNDALRALIAETKKALGLDEQSPRIRRPDW